VESRINIARGKIGTVAREENRDHAIRVTFL
jgi:hypothetical protein